MWIVIRFIVSIVFASHVFLAGDVLAQEPVPCDSCAGYPEGAFMTSGGPELGGDVHEMICFDNTWQQKGDRFSCGHLDF